MSGLPRTVAERVEQIRFYGSLSSHSPSCGSDRWRGAREMAEWLMALVCDNCGGKPGPDHEQFCARHRPVLRAEYLRRQEG